MTRTDTVEGGKTEWGERRARRLGTQPYMGSEWKPLQSVLRVGRGECELVIMVQHPSSHSPLPPPPRHLCLCYCQRKWGRQGVKMVGGMGKWRTRSRKKGGLRSSVVASPIVFSRLRLTTTGISCSHTCKTKKKTPPCYLFSSIYFEGSNNLGCQTAAAKPHHLRFHWSMLGKHVLSDGFDLLTQKMSTVESTTSLVKNNLIFSLHSFGFLHLSLGSCLLTNTSAQLEALQTTSREASKHNVKEVRSHGRPIYSASHSSFLTLLIFHPTTSIPFTTHPFSRCAFVYFKKLCVH